MLVHASTESRKATNRPRAAESIAAATSGLSGQPIPGEHTLASIEGSLSFESSAYLQGYVACKSVNSCFIGTMLEADLLARNIDALVLTGVSSDHCLNTTARMGAINETATGSRTVARSAAAGTHGACARHPRIRSEWR